MRLTLIFAAMILAAQTAFGAEPQATGLSPEEANEGFKSLFDGKTLGGWQGSTGGYAAENGALVCKKEGGGNLFTDREYGDFVLRFEFKLEPGGNNGLAVRAPLEGNPAYTSMELQILDDTADCYKDLQPYQFHGSVYGVVPSKPGFLKPVGEWNTQEVVAKGSRIKVVLNGTVIVDTDLKGAKPIDGQKHTGLDRTKGYLGFMGHGARLEFRNLRIKELPADADSASLPNPEAEEGFVPIFDGKTLDGWVGVAGNTDSYYVKDGLLIAKKISHDHIFTNKEYADFILRLDIKLEPGGNNGVGIRTKISRVPHLEGMEIQVLDDDAPKHKDILNYQHHGSIYGMVPAKTGHLKPAGEWNQEEIRCVGSHVTVTLNGTVIVDAELDKIEKPYMDGQEHPGVTYTKGRIGLHAHGDGEEVYFRNLRIKEL
jgi:hypothetical protein